MERRYPSIEVYGVFHYQRKLEGCCLNKISTFSIPDSVEQTLSLLANESYIADRGLAVTLLLALKLSRPIFLEGEPGVGKTEIAKVLAAALDTKLIRMQCYEGIDVSTAVYEWNYPAQMLAIRMSEASGSSAKNEIERQIYSEDYLIKRPLLEALNGDDGKPAILLIDELDRADEPFEAYLLELLADFQVSIPELGTIKAKQSPIVIITSNRTREIHDAVKRRCFYHWVDYPDMAREYEIVKLKTQGCADALVGQVVSFVQALRQEDVYKKPGVAESIDWSNALEQLSVDSLDVETVQETLGVVLKYQDDIEHMTQERVSDLLSKAQ